MKKRILTVLLAVCLVFALGTVGALAADGVTDCGGGENCQHVAAIGNTHYNTLEDAIANAQSGDTILLLDDVTLTNNSYTVEVGKSITIDGQNKYEIKGTFVCEAKSNTANQETHLTLKNLTMDGSNLANSTSNFAVNSNSNAQDAKRDNVVDLYLVIENCTIQNYGGKGLYLTNARVLTINNCEFKGNATDTTAPNIRGDYTIDLNLVAVENSVIEIEDTTFDSNAGAKAAIKVTARGLNDGTWASDISGDSASISSLTITECTFNQTKGDGAVDIRLGTDFKGTRTGSPESSSTNETGDFKVSIINSSTKNVEVQLAYKMTTEDAQAVNETVPAGKTYTKTATGDFAESGTFEASVTHSGVTNNYSKLADAIANAQAGDTVKLLQNVSIDGSAIQNNYGVITIDKNLTLDGNGKEITITGVTGEASTRPSAINIQSGADVTLKNLDVDSNGAKHGLNINGAGTVNLEDVEIMNSAWYAIVCNSSKLTVNGLYTHNNQWGVNVDKGSTATFTSANITETYSVVVGESETTKTEVNFNGGTYNTIQVKVSNTDINFNRGTFKNIEVISGKTPDISVQGGTFTTAVASSYVDTDYVAYNRTTGYTYTDSLSTAMNAAGQNGTVDYVAGNGWDVTLYYDKDVQTEIEVPKDYTFRLPGGTFEGKQIEGWKYGSEVFEPGDTDKITSDRTYYVILRNGQYNIVIDDDIKHGDVSTDVSSADKGATVYIYVDPDIGYVLDDLDVYYGYRNQYSVNVKFVRTGVYSFIMPGNNVYITATFRYESLPFTDVNRSQWFYDEVYYVYTNGMMEGDSATTFNPDGRMTRAMFWAVLGRIDGATITGNDWAEEARAWAMREGVSDGTNPNDYVTREQMVTMLWRYAGEKNGSASLIRYTDADKISSYAVEAMRWAIGNGIIEGMTSTTLEPQGTATRAQCAAIFMRFDQM